jgi:hypothetical protein
MCRARKAQDKQLETMSAEKRRVARRAAEVGTPRLRGWRVFAPLAFARQNDAIHEGTV